MDQIISNASPLIILARADLLTALSKQFDKVLIPQGVYEEICAGPDDDPMKIQIDSCDWLERITFDPPLSPLAYLNLGKGESEVIEYARLHEGSGVILDDKAARRVAKSLDIPLFGTLSITARAVRLGIFKSFDECLEKLKDSGLYLDAQIIAKVKNLLSDESKT
ncbi:hypothetical protein JXQ70_07275 [bacterium]|nr:hypothetical protein [bacterium]